jgi:hypothetical protein
LAFGFWPSFFSGNAATHVYFANATLYERDRPVFKQFVPILKAINSAGWEPLRSAALVAGAGVQQPPPDMVFVERFGSVSVGSLFWTMRNSGTVACVGLSLQLDLIALGLAVGPHRVDELTKSVMWPGKASVVHVTSSAHSSLEMPSLPPGKTLVIQVDINITATFKEKFVVKTDDALDFPGLGVSIPGRAPGWGTKTTHQCGDNCTYCNCGCPANGDMMNETTSCAEDTGSLLNVTYTLSAFKTQSATGPWTLETADFRATITRSTMDLMLWNLSFTAKVAIHMVSFPSLAKGTHLDSQTELYYMM